ncbi:MAG TPA: hypothetical protein [Caudoviricetes sp.]|nr:MAG TPA: hypothetical protein [Caudoviricetes sp.]DAY92158.1 MAG TPA: hypothetical protein [Caudoviricetes sp.]
MLRRGKSFIDPYGLGFCFIVQNKNYFIIP